MIEVQRLAKRFTQGRGQKARTVQAVDGVSCQAADGAHHRPARPQWRRQDDDAAHRSPR